MKKVLLIADTYYPDSRATIMIAQRIAEEMAQRGYSVKALPLHLENKKKIDYSEEHNSVSILELSDYSCTDRDYYKKINNLCYRVVLAPKKLLVKHPKSCGDKWNECLLRFVRKTRKEIYEKPKKNISLLEYTDIIKDCISKTKPDVIISVALPFEIHYCVSKAIGKSQIKWIPTCFDPYAFDEIIDQRETQKRKVQEKRAYKSATAVFMLSQFRNDYMKEKLYSKIKFVELPNIRPLIPSENPTHHFFDQNNISCAFIGNLYGVKRNPGFLFDLFEKMENKNIHLYIIGSLVDISQDDFELFYKKMNGRLHYLGRVGQHDAIDAMFQADVLVNVGHTTTNQCPSKVLDYMSTGKSILHISKITDCTSLPYLEKYGNCFYLDEKDGLRDEVIKDAEAFILSCKGKQRVPFDHVRDAFPNCTIEKYVDTIESCL